MPSDSPTIRASASEPARPEPAGPEPLGPEAAGQELPEPATPVPTSSQQALAQPADSAPEAVLTADAAVGGPNEPEASEAPSRPRKGPLSFLSGALTSGLLAWLCLGLSARVVAYYGEHPPHYEAQIAQSIATALKTLIVGMCFLATFSFAFIGVGLLLTFFRSLRPAVSGRSS